MSENINPTDSMHAHLKICTCNDNIFPINMRIKLNLIGDCSADGWWDWHVTEDFEYMSPKFWEILGYDPNEMKHHPSEWQKIIFPDDLIKAKQSFKIHIDSHGTIPFQEIVRYKHKSGKTLYIICRGKVIEWDGQSPVRLIGTHTDITEQEELKQLTIKEANNFKKLFEFGLTPCTIKNFDGSYLEVNNKFCELTEYSKEELITKSFETLTVKEDQKEDLNRIKQLMSDNSITQNFQKRIITKTNHIIWCQVMQTVIEYNDQQAIFAQITNINKKRKIMEDIKILQNTIKNL